MLKELGLEDTDTVFQDPDTAKIMNYMMALYPKLGYNPENLTSLIDIAKKQQESINRQMSGSIEATDMEKKQSSDARFPSILTRPLMPSGYFSQ